MNLFSLIKGGLYLQTFQIEGEVHQFIFELIYFRNLESINNSII